MVDIENVQNALIKLLLEKAVISEARYKVVSDILINILASPNLTDTEKKRVRNDLSKKVKLNANDILKTQMPNSLKHLDSETQSAILKVIGSVQVK